MSGFGKSQAGVWQLSERSYTLMPWVIIDHKDDELIRAIPYQKPATFETEFTEPGIYVIHPTSYDYEAGKVDALLMRIWERENCGVFIDEGMNLGNSLALRQIFAAGRTHRTPVILCTQRPKKIELAVFTEANFIQCFFLQFVEDRERIEDYLPRSDEVDWGAEIRDLPDYHSLWYDVRARQVVLLRPVPSTTAILERFRQRLAPPEPTTEAKPKRFALL